MITQCVPRVEGENIAIYFKGYTSELNMQHNYIIIRSNFYIKKELNHDYCFPSTQCVLISIL